jgi:hypothetical protein
VVATTSASAVRVIGVEQSAESVRKAPRAVLLIWIISLGGEDWGGDNYAPGGRSGLKAHQRACTQPLTRAGKNILPSVEKEVPTFHR